MTILEFDWDVEEFFSFHNNRVQKEIFEDKTMITGYNSRKCEQPGTYKHQYTERMPDWGIVNMYPVICTRMSIPYG